MSKRQDDNPNLSHEAAPLRVLHVGPGQGQRGGIASVLAELGAQRARFRHAGVVVAIFETHGFQSMRSLLCFALVDIPRGLAPA